MVAQVTPAGRKIMDDHEEAVGVPNRDFTAERETWKNEAAGMVYIKKVDPRGYDKDVPMQPGQQVGLTTQERRYNQGLVANSAQDPFTNGTLRPIKLIEGTEDYEELMANPNVMSDDDLGELFELRGPEFEAQIATMGNVITLQHMLVVAEQLDARASQIRALESRIAIAQMSGMTQSDDRGRVTETNNKVVEAPRHVDHPSEVGDNPMNNIQRTAI